MKSKPNVMGVTKGRRRRSKKEITDVSKDDRSISIAALTLATPLCFFPPVSPIPLPYLPQLADMQRQKPSTLIRSPAFSPSYLSISTTAPPTRNACKCGGLNLGRVTGKRARHKSCMHVPVPPSLRFLGKPGANSGQQREG